MTQEIKKIPSGFSFFCEIIVKKIKPDSNHLQINTLKTHINIIFFNITD